MLAVLAAAAVFGAWVAVRWERARVARGNLLGAKALVKTARPIYWHHLGRAAVATVLAAGVVLACVYLASTGER